MYGLSEGEGRYKRDKKGRKELNSKGREETALLEIKIDNPKTTLKDTKKTYRVALLLKRLELGWKEDGETENTKLRSALQTDRQDDF